MRKLTHYVHCALEDGFAFWQRTSCNRNRKRFVFDSEVETTPGLSAPLEDKPIRRGMGLVDSRRS